MLYDGKKIRSLRESKGWSMGELARRAGLAQPSLWALEHQVTKSPKFSTIAAVAAALGVPARELLAAKARKKDVPTSDDLEAIFEALDDRNKRVLLAAAQAMLKDQPK